MVEEQFQTNMFSVFFYERFNRNRELIPNCWRSHRESTFANIQFSFRNKRLLGNRCSKSPRDVREM